MFGNESKYARNWEFGARIPNTSLKEVQDQMHLAHVYHNRLVALERERRDKVEVSLRELAPGLCGVDTRLAALEAEIEEIRDRIKKRNAKERKRAASKEDRQKIADLKLQLKEGRATRKLMRSQLFDSLEWKTKQEDINQWHSAQQKASRAASGLYWGTYLTVEQSMSGARSGAPPQFQRWRGDGSVSVQLQGGLSVDELLAAQDKRLRVTFEEGGKTFIWIRIGSDGREPIWCKVRFTLHRSLPDGVRVKWCKLIRRRVGTRNEWRVILTLEAEEASVWEKKDRADSGVVGIDVGWRLLPEGLRVAYWYGDNDEYGQLVIPSQTVGRWGESENLQSVISQHLNAVLPVVSKWFKSLGSIPEWAEELGVDTLSQWRSPERLQKLVDRWRTNRIPGDDQEIEGAGKLRQVLHLDIDHYGSPVSMYDLMEAWAKKWRHLHNWAAGTRLKAIRYRRDLYRNFVAEMRRKYKTVHLEKLNLVELRRKPTAEETAADGGVVMYRDIAAVGELRRYFSESMDVGLIPAKDTTRMCHLCEKLSGESSPASLIHTCSHCASQWDQDLNAAVNLLRGTPITAEEAAADAAVEVAVVSATAE